jgi:hypothetical protein
MNKKIHLTAITDENGVLNLRIPTDAPRQKFNVFVTLKPLTDPSDEDKQTDGWPDGFFEATAGSFSTDPLSIPKDPFPEKEHEEKSGAEAFKDLIGAVSFREDSSTEHDRYIYSHVEKPPRR